MISLLWSYATKTIVLKYLSFYIFLIFLDQDQICGKREGGGSTHGLFYSCKLRDWKEARRGLKKGLPEGCGTIFYEHQQEWRAGELVVVFRFAVFILYFIFLFEFIFNWVRSLG